RNWISKQTIHRPILHNQRMGRRFRNPPEPETAVSARVCDGANFGRAGRPSLFSWGAAKSPAINGFQGKAPIAAHSKRWDAPVSDEAINGRWVNTQEFGDFVEGENFVHFSASLLYAEPHGRLLGLWQFFRVLSLDHLERNRFLWGARDRPPQCFHIVGVNARFLSCSAERHVELF